ncbi:MULTISPECIES: sigma-70 family RNA polymerase sigma factor [unclassified Micromonospora]|uniref:RNA polymerase sigma factor n=1 Tax=Micromonospora TaxID=1873 RepID=UPI002417D381|nr:MULTISPECIES: sigma-70 family RNA polymerase sigma factor [unclassified Micromonospora]MDG4819308.1 sigma-70 family RNA polymerase sigma factor [Micromonospora sp. WMMD956]WFE55768.1 sigma-70 family RNA polymerase sigma factor [Micromonospora sp. WMMD712]
MTDTTATRLVAAASDGDEAAWAELVRRYTPLVVAVIRAHGMSRADAADVNQTVWLRLVERLGQLRDPEALAAWLATTTRRECYRLSRLDRRMRPVDPYDDTLDARHGSLVDAVTPDEELLRAERRQALREGFAQLPPRCQDLLALLTADPPASYREIGERLGMPVGSIGPTQARCLRKLRACPALAPFLGVRRGLDTSGGERDGAVAAGR